MPGGSTPSEGSGRCPRCFSVALHVLWVAVALQRSSCCDPGLRLPPLWCCRFMSLVHDLIVGTLDASQYEDACRALLGKMLLQLNVALLKQPMEAFPMLQGKH